MQAFTHSYRRAGFIIALLLGVVAVPLSAFDDEDDDEGEETIAVEELPDAIREALEGVDIAEAERVGNDDDAVYEIAIETDDVEFELQLTPSAQLVGIEIEHENDEEEDDDEEDEGEDDEEDDDDRE